MQQNRRLRCTSPVEADGRGRSSEGPYGNKQDTLVWSSKVCRNVLTESKLTLILPTLVAPTGTIPKKPCRHRPRSATRSLSTNRFWRRLAIYGDTENSSPGLNVSTHKMALKWSHVPTKCLRFSTTHAVGLWKRW